MTCLISASAIKYLLDHTFGQEGFQIFGEGDEPLRELLDVAHGDVPTTATTHLRGFFAIECAIYVALKSALASAGEEGLFSQLCNVLPLVKSYEGLESLLSELRQIDHTLHLDQLELGLMGDGHGQIGGLHAKLLEGPRRVISYIISMAEALRPEFNYGHGDLEGVGIYLARVLSDTFQDPPTCAFWIHKMLTTSMENPSTWSEKTAFQG